MAVDQRTLGTYLGIDDIDGERAELLIAQASALATALVSPLPEAADAVVLSAAARAYTNPTNITNEGAGPYQVTRPSGGVYLTKAERATLRRLNGGGGAFSINLIGDYASRYEAPAP